MKRDNRASHSPIRNYRRRSLLTVIAVAISFLPLSLAQATAIGEADVHAQLTFSMPANGIEFGVIDTFSITDTIENGHASATAQAPSPESIGHGIQASASTTATAMPRGSALGIGAAFGVVKLTNTTINPIGIDFTLAYDWSLQGSTDHPDVEQAFTEIALDIFMNDVSHFAIFEDASTAPNFMMESGNSLLGTSITQVFSNVAIPSGTTFVEIAVAAQTEAMSTPVPEPSTWILFGSGLIGLTLFYRKNTGKSV